MKALVSRADPSFCAHGNDVSRTAWGVTTDLLMTGVWLYGEASCRQQIQERLLREFSALSSKHAGTGSFARSCRFGRNYRLWLADRLAKLNRSISTSESRPCTTQGLVFLYGSANNIVSKLPPPERFQNQRLPSAFRSLPRKVDCDLNPKSTHSAFTSNSTSCIITVPAGAPTTFNTNIFCKSSRYQDQEIRVAAQAALFYPRVQIPLLSDSGYLLYPFFEGASEAECRLSFIQNGRSDMQTAELVLHAELVKAEDMLRAYQRSFRVPTHPRSLAQQPIHRFYHDRLVENTRLGEIYSSGIRIHDRTLPVMSFIDILFQVNGVSYPSLKQICQAAPCILDPTTASSCPSVFGLGGAHGGNTMIANKTGLNGSRELLYVDYEVAGYHSVMLDLAKPFLNDIFFEELYADVIRDLSPVEYTLANDVMIVAPVTDQLSQEILNIKKKYLLEPLIQSARKQNCDLESYIPQLASALFACSALTRNFSGEWDCFFRNIAVGIVLSQATNWEGLWACCTSLGVHHRIQRSKA